MTPPSPSWWMGWLEDGSNPVAYFQKKYGQLPTHIEVPLDYPQTAIKKLEAAGFKVVPCQAVYKGLLFLGCAGLQPAQAASNTKGR